MGYPGLNSAIVKSRHDQDIRVAKLWWDDKRYHGPRAENHHANPRETPTRAHVLYDANRGSPLTATSAQRAIISTSSLSSQGTTTSDLQCNLGYTPEANVDTHEGHHFRLACAGGLFASSGCCAGREAGSWPAPKSSVRQMDRDEPTTSGTLRLETTGCPACQRRMANFADHQQAAPE
ncbi:hypothetical protein ACCO45_012524 [Purpureocillium lilacinum]|uniref:Uncharacterized protein n=1 Tax=Purpureocillium lilacinum TaxID=33203 RepID=A0ACC4D8N4_PURLI